MTRIALNGLGRIGKLALRDLIDTGAGGEIVLINDPAGTPEQHALLMEFDSVHGRWRTPVDQADGALILNGQGITTSGWLIIAQLVGLLSGILGVMVFTAKPVKAKSAKKTAKK